MASADRPRILVIGNAFLDILLGGKQGLPLRNWPGPGQRLVVDSDELDVFMGGNGCNVAAGLSALGCEVTLLTALGHDDAGRSLHSELTDFDVRVRNLTPPRATLSTGHSFVLTSDDDPSYLVIIGANKLLTVEGVSGVASELAPFDALLLVGLGTMPGLDGHIEELIPVLQAIRERASRDGGELPPLVIDVTLLEESSRLGRGPEQLLPLLRCASYVTPNLDEACLLLGLQGDSKQDPMLVADKLMKAIECEAIAVKTGETGCVIASERGCVEVSHDRVPMTELKDEVGAGDAWLAGFVSTLLRAKRDFAGLEAAAAEGNRCGAASVRSVGGVGWLAGDSNDQHAE